MGGPCVSCIGNGKSVVKWWMCLNEIKGNTSAVKSDVLLVRSTTTPKHSDVSWNPSKRKVTRRDRRMKTRRRKKKKRRKLRHELVFKGPVRARTFVIGCLVEACHCPSFPKRLDRPNRSKATFRIFLIRRQTNTMWAHYEIPSTTTLMV